MKPREKKRGSKRRIILISAGSVLSVLLLIGILVFLLSGQPWWKSNLEETLAAALKEMAPQNLLSKLFKSGK